jgi:endonuclease/exonuclease/phosphatase family metal-dependent hydrolase
MKLMSFNTQHCLNYLEKRVDYEIMARAIGTVGADIVGLNEMRDTGSHPRYTAQVKTLAKLTGLENHYFAKAIDFDGNPYGNGLISRFSIVSAETIKIPDPEPKKYDGYYESRCVLKAKLDNGLTVLAVHFGLNPDEQENAVHTILPLLEKEKCILMGDFNVVPDDKILLPIRERMVDTAEFFDAPKLSFPSDNPTIKIDYIFVSKDIQVVEADIPAIVAADHRPHTATVVV